MTTAEGKANTKGPGYFTSGFSYHSVDVWVAGVSVDVQEQLAQHLVKQEAAWIFAELVDLGEEESENEGGYD